MQIRDNTWKSQCLAKKYMLRKWQIFFSQLGKLWALVGQLFKPNPYWFLVSNHRVFLGFRGDVPVKFSSAMAECKPKWYLALRVPSDCSWRIWNIFINILNNKGSYFDSMSFPHFSLRKQTHWKMNWFYIFSCQLYHIPMLKLKYVRPEHECAFV